MIGFMDFGGWIYPNIFWMIYLVVENWWTE